MKLTWQVHGGDTTGIVVERRIEDGKEGRGAWKRIAKLAPGATEYSDSEVKNGQGAAFRVRAVNADGESAYSNIARIAAPSK